MKFLLTGDKSMSQMHLRQKGFYVYSARIVPAGFFFVKIKKGFKNLKKQEIQDISSKMS